MKRKVIKQGNGTLTITLPKKWTEEVGLKGGDYLEVFEKGNELSILSKSEKEVSKINVDLTNLKSTRAVIWVLSALPKSGFDEIEIFYKSPKILKIIQKLIKDAFTGFAIMEQSQKRILIRSISKDSYSELEPSLRRAFLVTLSLADSILEQIKNKDFSNIKELVALEKSNNQFTNFCERLLVKKGYQKPAKTIFKYIIVWNIEKVCDCYKELCLYIDKEKITSFSKEITKLYQDVLTFFRNFYELIYKFDLSKLEKLLEEGKILSSKLENYCPKKNYEYKIIRILNDVVERVTNFSGPLISLNIGN